MEMLPFMSNNDFTQNLMLMVCEWAMFVKQSYYSKLSTCGHIQRLSEERLFLGNAEQMGLNIR